MACRGSGWDERWVGMRLVGGCSRQAARQGKSGWAWFRSDLHHYARVASPLLSPSPPPYTHTHLLVDVQQALQHPPHHHAWGEVHVGTDGEDVLPRQVPE